MKIFAKIVLVLLPVMLALGLVRYATHGFSGDLLPYYDSYLMWFSTFPDLTAEVQSLNEMFFIDQPFIFGLVGVIAYVSWVVTIPIRLIVFAVAFWAV